MASTVRSADERCCSTAGCRAAALALATGASAGGGPAAGGHERRRPARPAPPPPPPTGPREPRPLPDRALRPPARRRRPPRHRALRLRGGAGRRGAGLRRRSRWGFGRRRTRDHAATLAPEPASPPLGAAAPPTIPATLAPGSQGAAPLGASGAPAAIAIPGGAPAAMSGGATAAIAGAGPGAGSRDGVAASGGGVVRTGVTGAPISPAARANSRVVPRLPSRRCRSAGAGTGGRRPADATRSATGGRGRVTGRWTRWRVTATDVRRTGPAWRSASVSTERRAAASRSTVRCRLGLVARPAALDGLHVLATVGVDLARACTRTRTRRRPPG